MKDEIPLKFIALAITLITAIALGVYTVCMGYKYESIGDTHLYHMLSARAVHFSPNYPFYGSCESNAVLLGVYYSLMTGKPFYLVVYPTEKHVAVIIDGTMYTTAMINNPIHIYYICNINKEFRKGLISSNNRTFITTYREALSSEKPLVKCAPSLTIPYSNINVKIYGGVLFMSIDQLKEMYNRYGTDFIKNILMG